MHKIKEYYDWQGSYQGGLKPENVRQAIKEVQPFAVDVCSGVRTDGLLDKEKLEGFVENALNDHLFSSL